MRNLSHTTLLPPPPPPPRMHLGDLTQVVAVVRVRTATSRRSEICSAASGFLPARRLRAHGAKLCRSHRGSAFTSALPAVRKYGDVVPEGRHYVPNAEKVGWGRGWGGVGVPGAGGPSGTARSREHLRYC